MNNAMRKFAAVAVCLLAALVLVSGPIALVRSCSSSTPQATIGSGLQQRANDAIPPTVRWIFANSTARTNFTPTEGLPRTSGKLREYDIGSEAWQQSDDTFWSIKSINPVVWIAKGSGGGAHAASHLTGSSDPISLVTTTTDGLAIGADKALFEKLFTTGALMIDWDDFQAGGVASTGAAQIATAGSTATFGKLNWRAITTGTASAVTLVTTNQDAAHQGIVELNTGTTTTGYGFFGNFPSGAVSEALAAGIKDTRIYRFRVPTASNGTDTFTVNAGWMSAMATATPTDGLYFQASSAAPSSGNWICRSCVASSCTLFSGGSTVAFAANTWVDLQIDYDGTGTPTATCKVDGVSIGTSTAIPTAGMGDAAGCLKSAGTTARTCLVDKIWRKHDTAP